MKTTFLLLYGVMTLTSVIFAWLLFALGMLTDNPTYSDLSEFIGRDHQRVFLCTALFMLFIDCLVWLFTSRKNK